MVENQKAREIWAGMPNSALFPKTLAISQKGVYAFRLSKGIDIFGAKKYKIEVITVLRLLDDFCVQYTTEFYTLKYALKHLHEARNVAQRHYKQLEKKVNDRG